MFHHEYTHITQYGPNKVLIDAVPVQVPGASPSAELKVMVDGRAVGMAQLNATGTPKSLKLRSGLEIDSRRAGNDAQEVHVTTPGLQLVIRKERTSRHLDLTMSVLRADMTPMHGVVGQTFGNRTRAFVGDEGDYLVSGLWASDCKTCGLFKPETSE